MSIVKTIKPVQIIGQPTDWTCWEACAEMIWYWRFGNTPSAEQSFMLKLDNFIKMASGSILPQGGLTKSAGWGFYLILGLRSLHSPKNKNIKHALGWSPVIITIKIPPNLHAVVVDGYSNGIYKIINPQDHEEYNFDEKGNSVKTWVGARITVKEKEIDVNIIGDWMWYW